MNDKKDEMVFHVGHPKERRNYERYGIAKQKRRLARREERKVKRDRLPR